MRFPHAQESRPIDDATQPNRRFLIFLVLMLAACVMYVVSSALSPTGAEVYKNSLAAAAPAASPSPSIAECLENAAWPAQFEIPFTTYAHARSSPWPGGLMQYQYLETSGTVTANFRSFFPKCPNLSFVPLTFYGRPCAFYFVLDPQDHRWLAYVFSIERKRYFKLAANLGPLFPDFAARYRAVLPEACADNPLPDSPVAVRNPPGGQTAQWFLTSGSRKINTPATTEGYYAAIATPVTGPDGKQYKPPFAFTGAPPGLGFLFGKNLAAYGELVYDYTKFTIKSSFPPDTFVPPLKYTKVIGIKMAMPAPSPSPGASPVPTPLRPNCVVCHISDLKDDVTFYFEARRAARAYAISQKKKG